MKLNFIYQQNSIDLNKKIFKRGIFLTENKTAIKHTTNKFLTIQINAVQR